ncbi:4-hydroxy-tetrahydrodipicolinate synthase [Clostridium bornimense]|uniref:4-hydroxy-tetrahydrodipicolinate synthase n=1 Tax=Clostridium bornimense TaxID=1216932 RepID=UPI001C120A1F|nr:4-hydroxy-tetrahydrodipicolinate synthase [Clostridium bornimense]MBU5316454.1 4-hydroxy-tetrahydrodipicolinate synthase [Clostridium bornimense]
MKLFTGSGVALVTPFNDNGVDFDKLEELIEYHIKNDTDAIIICGTTGEATTMTEEEKKSTIKFTVEKANGRIPIIAGSGSNNTAAAIAMSVWCEKIGVDGVLVITPYYNKSSDKGVIEHFKAISSNINIPIILYNVPSRTGLNLKPSIVKELSKLPNIVGVKEASGDLSQVLEIRALCGEDFLIYSGNDDQIIPILSLGGAGVISVLANIVPKEVHNMCALYMEGKTKEALKIQVDTLDLCKNLFIETNPIPVKTALNLMNFNVGPLRLPLVDMEENNLKSLETALKSHGLI